MEDLVGEENADWGLVLGSEVPFEAHTDTVAGLEHDIVDLPGSHRHDQEPRRKDDSVSVGVANHGSRGHDSDFSSLLDGLEKDLGVPTGVNPVPAPSKNFPRGTPRRSCATSFRTQGRFGPRFTRRHTAVPFRTGSWQMKIH